jgi:hypothetical protein
VDNAADLRPIILLKKEIGLPCCISIAPIHNHMHLNGNEKYGSASTGGSGIVFLSNLKATSCDFVH